MSTNTLTYSTELMDNYLSAEVVSPQKKFNAVQTADGHALLFAISTSGHFFLFAQTPGHATGWKRYDLSKKIFKHHRHQRVKVRTFAVAENARTGKIDLAMAVRINGSDHLYLSLGNDNTMGAITGKSIKWHEVAYDDPDHKGIKVHITELYISQSSREEYIVADISRQTFKKPSQFINRYHIDPAKSTGRAWNNMVVGGDLEADIHSSLGRMQDERVDGTYNLGKINGKTELMYAPLYNPFSRSAPPTITTFKVPKGATALDTAYVGHETALFVAAQKELYYYAADKQHNNASGKLVLKSPFFVDVTKLFAYATADTFIVWGINRANQVFYTTCPIKEVDNSSAWSVPLPLISGVDQVSPYVNKADNGNVFFAVAGNELFKMVQSPETTIWKKSQVHLKTKNAKTKKFNSFTTRLQLADEKGTLMANEELYLSTPSRTPFYINHLYYVLDKTPIPVKTDVHGSITLVEMVHDINGAQIKVSEKGGEAITIDPSEKPFQKMVALDSKEKLKNAQIESADGTKTPLFTDHSKLDQVVQANAALAEAHKKVSGTDGDTTKKAETTEPKEDKKQEKAVALVKAGDLFGFLDSNAGHTLTVHHDPLTSVWKAVVSFGEFVYHAVLDTLDAIYSALKWIYHATGLDKLIEYLSYLFAWSDFNRTKKVYKNMIMCFLKHEIAQIGEARKAFDGKMNQVLDALDGWAGITDDFRIGDNDEESPTSQPQAAGHNSAPGHMLLHHYSNNGRSTTELDKEEEKNPVEGLLTSLITALENEGKIFEDCIVQLWELLKESSTMSVLDIVKRIVGIVVGDVLKSVQVLVDAFMDIMENVADMLLKIMDTKIYIPVISDIFKLIGIDEISFMDLFCYIAAVPATIAFKATHNKAPFPDNKYTDFLIKAEDWKEIKQAFSGTIPGNGLQNITSTHTSSAMNAHLTTGSLHSLNSLGFTSGRSSDIVSVNTSARTILCKADDDGEFSNSLLGINYTMPDSMAYSIYVSGYMLSAFCSFISAAVCSMEALEKEPDNVFGKPAAVLGILGAFGAGTAAILVPRCAIKNEGIMWVHRILIGFKGASKGIFSSIGQKNLPNMKVFKFFKVKNNRGVGAIVSSGISLLSLTCSIWHFMELGKTEASNDKTAAVLEETTNLVSDLKDICYAVAVNDPEPLSQAVATGIMATSYVANFGLYTAVAAIDGV